MKKLALLAWLFVGAQAVWAQPPSYPEAPLPAWKQSFFHLLSASRESSPEPAPAPLGGQAPYSAPEYDSLMPKKVPDPFPAPAPEPALSAGKQSFFNFLSTSREKPAKPAPAEQSTAIQGEPPLGVQAPFSAPEYDSLMPKNVPDPVPTGPELPKKKETHFGFFSLDRDFGEGPVADKARTLSNYFAKECSNNCLWGSGEYLLWWVRNDPLPFPLVTTGNPNLPQAGVLGGGNSTTLLGGSGFDTKNFSGTRLTLGGWIDQDKGIGAEVSGFFLFQRSVGFSAGSDANGNPPLYIPAFNASLGREDRLVVSDPNLLFSGNVAISSELQLWGVEANGIYRLVRNSWLDISLLAGFRYLDLNETFLLQNTTTDLALGNVTSLFDNFHTQNQFFGGQLGARGQITLGPLTAGLCAKVALGDTHEVVSVNGSLTQSGATAPNPGTFPGGFFALPSNIGRQTGDTFSVVPQVGARVGFAVTSRLTAFVGYDFLYWTQVVRPGDQIDRVVNPTQSQNPNFGGIGALFGPTQPVPQFNRSDFFAHGASVGVQFRY